MAEIKNLHMVTEPYPDHLSEKDLHMMDQAAIAHRKLGGVAFKIVEYTPDKVIFQVVQAKHPAGNYHTKHRLVEIVHETFDRFFPDHRIMVQPIPFKESAASKVTPEWIRNKMTKQGIRIKDIAEETGTDRAHLSSITSGDKPLSNVMKAFFWLYFQVKDYEGKL